MGIYENELRDKWNSINYYSGGSLQLSVNHPLEWYVRYVSPKHKSLVIVSEDYAKNISSSKSIEASCNQRKDGKYATIFTLMDEKQEDVFITMSSDIMEFSYTKQPKQSLKRAIRRYLAWLRLLDHKRDAIMSVNSQKGLAGELLFLKEKIESGIDVDIAVAGWGGPDGADQDFSYEQCWYEIKTTGAASNVISISSVEQLDSNQEGELVVYRIDQCVPTKKGSFTLYHLVHKLFDLLRKDESVLYEFVMKLGSAGYIDMKEYDTHFFLFSSKQSYKVDKDFPKLMREALPVGIINAQYQLNIQNIVTWEK